MRNYRNENRKVIISAASVEELKKIGIKFKKVKWVKKKLDKSQFPNIGWHKGFLIDQLNEIN